MKFLNIFIRNKRKVMYFFVYLIAIFIGTIVIHEAGHLLAALALGVPLDEIKIGLIKGMPGITIPECFSNTSISVYHYTGGFSAAAVLISIYFLLWYRRYRVQPSLLMWTLGLVTITFSCEEVGNAVVEGHFHAAYIFLASSPFSVVNIMLLCFGALGFILHFLLCQPSKAYFAEIGHVFGMKPAGLSEQIGHPCLMSGTGLRYKFNSVYYLFQSPPSYLVAF